MKESHSHRTIVRRVVNPRLLAVVATLAIAPLACSSDEDGGGGGGATGGKSPGTGGTAAGGAGAGTGGTTAGTGGATAGTGGAIGGTGGATAGTGGTTAGTGGTPTAGAGGEDSGLGGAGGEVGVGGEGGGSGGDPGLVVFDDAYREGLGFIAFGGSTNNVSVDGTGSHSGSSSLKVEVPAAGYTGGSLVAGTGVDLSQYDAMVFWAKASVAHNLDSVGFGNDAAGGVAFNANLGTLPLTTEWTEFVVPIPSPAALSAEKGLFYFAEGEGSAYTIWFDDIRFVNLDTIGAPQPSVNTTAKNVLVGDTFTVPGGVAVYSIDGTDQTVHVGPGYFNYSSEPAGVVTVDANGLVTAAAAGTTELTLDLEGVTAGALTVTVAEATEPAVAAPTPTNDAGNVISLFSDAFTNVTVNDWSTTWDAADVADVTVATNATKLYTAMTWAAVQFTSSPIDATTMTTLHFDVWLPAATSFAVKLVDFGADGAYQGGDDSEHEITQTGLATGTWVPLDFQLDSFTNLASRAHLAQMILVMPAGSTVYIDNIYFYKP